MLSMWFKVLVFIIAGLQFAASNFDEFVENEELFNEGVQTEISGTLSAFRKNVGNLLPKFLPHSESTTPRFPTEEEPSNFSTQIPSGPPYGSIISQSITKLVNLPYEGARAAKDLLLPKGISGAGSHAGGLWNRNADPIQEHGNLEQFGREFVKKIYNAFDRSDTQGLDTNATFYSGMMDKFKEYVHFIYPGTIWCGDGDQADKYTDLGVFAEPDKCCRAHDKCQNNIEKGGKKYGLENTGMFTRSHCTCDRNFYKCLKDSKSAVGFQIGVTYFTILGPQCFEEKQKIARCDKTFMNRCIQYSFRDGKEKKYQWFDNPTF